MGKWTKEAEKVNAETLEALQTVVNELNHGQQKKILKNPDVKALFDFYGVKCAVTE